MDNRDPEVAGAPTKEVAPTTTGVSSSPDKLETGRHLPRLQQQVGKIAQDHFKTVWMSPACHWTPTRPM